ncbi:MAG TPA: lamin tail domain-containing protein [Methylomirabilota bacterium]|nr:lamin tail domain-containing protein [Methylomirabilota bacterium]
MKHRILVALSLLLLGLSSVFAEGPVVINEIHADPDVKTELVEFIELHNPTAQEVDVSNWSFTEGVTYTFPAGTKIPPNGYLVVGENPTHFQQKFNRTALGPWQGKLSSEGERIMLRDNTGKVVDEVEYGIGFPWPITGSAPGPSLELVNPLFDNDLGGHWRPSGSGASGTPTLRHEPNWRFFKGTSEASSPTSAWRQINYNDSGWLSGPGPIGYGENFLNTTLSDMRNNYASIFARRVFTLDNPAAVSSLALEILFDDGVNVWINGQHVFRNNLNANELPFNATTANKTETGGYEVFDISAAIPFLVQGKNVIAIQAHNSSLTESSDFYLDALLAVGSGVGGNPTPGRANSVLANNVGPQLRQVDHSPEQPKGGQPVLMTVKATDAQAVTSVKLQYQVVQPGAYIELNDPTYATSWIEVDMRDDGQGGDVAAGDDVFSYTMPASVQVHRRLVRYRIKATDGAGLVTMAPYAEDPEPNFAYFVYNGVPAWTGAIEPGSADATRRQVVTYSSEEMSRLPVYHIISKSNTVFKATWGDRYGDDDYPYRGTLVYDGKVYDHIGFRARGGVWRYAMGKNMWKIDLNRGHSFEARDNWGRRYKTSWTKLNLGANIQQGDYLHRGEQGMFESVGLRLFNLAGVEGPKTHWAQLRIIDEASETGANQYQGDFWGLYLAVEQEDGRFLDEHNLPDGNLYKMEGGTGELNNLGFLGPSNKSDLNAFQNAYRTTQTDDWWRQNFDLNGYYNYHAIVQGIHHYDISFGKNYFYYRNPETGRWSVLPWDLDLTWADNMYEPNSGGRDDFTPVLSRPAFNIEWENRVRELRDLLFNSDQAHTLIDEYANIVKGTNTANILGADRAMWDYNPIMVSQYVNTGKAGHGKFYRFEYESRTNAALRGSFDAVRDIMKLYVNYRGQRMDSLYGDTAIPQRPTISNAGSPTFAANAVRLRSSAYAGPSPFAAVKWRVAEVTPQPVVPQWPAEPRKYEINADWESAEITSQQLEVSVPAHVLKPGRTYRARVKMKDSTGRWSNWSEPLAFTASEPDGSQLLVDHLRITELLFDPPAGTDYEFVELHNTSTTTALDLAGVSFTAGITFTFTNLTLPPDTRVVLHKAATPTQLAAFKQRYSLPANVLLAGPYSGSLNNTGEQLRLKTSAAGREIVDFEYRNNNHWPTAAQGAGHSLVLTTEGMVAPAIGGLNYPGYWRASVFPNGSPGVAEPAPTIGLVINEVKANTVHADPARPEYDSNDWIEIRNPLSVAVSTAGYYLSDDPANLLKWALPLATLAPGEVKTYYEIGGFHDPITTGFGLSKDGESLFLSRTEGFLPQVMDAVDFDGQSTNSSWGRAPESPTLFRALVPTPNAPNTALPPTVVITEIMFQPQTNTSGLDVEFIELQNVSSAPVSLGDAAGSWQITGGADYVFSAETVLQPSEVIVLADLAPTNAPAVQAFRQSYAMPANVRIFGPLGSKLDNWSDSLFLQRPNSSNVPGETPGWISVDEITYAAGAPWPTDTQNTGRSLHRVSATTWGNIPTNWRSATPTPGSHVPVAGTGDTDGDGMPDEWESAHGLNPQLADALLDLDNDGLRNLDEYRAGTDPNNAGSALRFTRATPSNGLVSLAWLAQPGRTYRLEFRSSLGAGSTWSLVREFPAHNSPNAVNLTYSATTTETGSGFYRLVIPQ